MKRFNIIVPKEDGGIEVYAMKERGGMVSSSRQRLAQSTFWPSMSQALSLFSS
jgi:hypothetical protein